MSSGNIDSGTIYIIWDNEIGKNMTTHHNINGNIIEFTAEED